MASNRESEEFIEKELHAVPVPPTSCSVLLGNFLVAVKYVWAETKKDRRSFTIGLFTVMLVVFSITLLQNTIGHAPILFLKLAENSVGEYDIVLTPKKTVPGQSSFFLNYTDVSRRIANESSTTGCTSRWLFIGDVFNTNDTNRNSSAILLIIDSQKEREIGLGREWGHPSLEGKKIHASAALLRLLGIKSSAGKTVTLRLDFFSLLHTVSGTSETQDSFIRNTLTQILVQVYASNQTNAAIGEIPFSFENILGQIRAISPQLGNYVDGLGPKYFQDAFISFLKRRGITEDSIKNGSTISDSTIALIQSAASFDTDVEVVDAIDLPRGKFPESLGNVVVIEMELWNEIARQMSLNLLQYVGLEILDSLGVSFSGNSTTGQQFLDNLPGFTGVKNFIERLDMREFSLTVIIMFKERFSTFLKTKEDIDADMITFSNSIMELLGINYPVTITAPLVNVLRVLYYMRLFLDQLLLVVQLFLVTLGSLLVYSLLLAEVEGKVYECGMLRALGMEQYTLIELLSIQSLIFSVPGIVLGLALAYIAYIPIGNYFSWFSAIPLGNSFAPSALIMGISLGFVMPFVALIAPTRRALSKSLRDALDLYHSLASDTSISIQSLENLGISPAQTWISMMAVIFGFVVYYLIPYSFIFFYWALFFDIFVFIMFGLVLGLSLLGVTVHPFAQTLVLNLIMWGADRRKLKPIVQKNLAGHGRRNSKTSILFTICIAFIIFAGTVFRQQENTLISKAKLSIGADIVIQSFQETIPLDWEKMTKYLEKEKQRPDTILRAYTFSTFGLETADFVRRTQTSNLADWPRRRVLFFGVERNFFDVVYDEYLETKELTSGVTFPTTKNGKPDIVKSIFDNPTPPDTTVVDTNIFSVKARNENTLVELNPKDTYSRPIDVIGSEAMRFPVSVDANGPIELAFDVITNRTGRYTISTTFHFLAHIRAMASSVPGFVFSSYSQTALLTPMLTSIDNYEWLLSICRNSSYLGGQDLPRIRASRRALYIRVDPDSSIEQREDIINGLRSYITDDRVIISNTKDVLRSTETAVTILDVFFDIVAFMVIILCFFLLFVAFTTNINENAWEFGVLRALGMTAFQVVRVYVYEALALVLASVIIGFIIGDIVSVTLGLQACLFSELPFTFSFPYILFSGVVFMSLMVAVFGSYIPARSLLNKKIASALKNL